MKIIILAGGSGTRLWPLSRANQPKQFSRLMGEKTMLETTLERFLGEFQPKDLYICLNKNLVEQAKQLAPAIPLENYIVEPEKRDTAPAMGLVAATLFNKFPDEPIAFVPSDHFISDKEKFLKIIRKAEELIKTTGKMVDIAIHPTFPSTVLGYTKIGEKLPNGNGLEVYNFLGHTEKPDFETAKAYLEDANYLWHANYYMWTPRQLLQAFEKYSPSHYPHLKNIVEYLNQNNQQFADNEFCRMEKISFDYAITEKIDNSQVLIIKGEFGWSDLGAFDVLYEAQKAKVDSDYNIAFGNCVADDTSNCLIYGKGDKLIATLGVDDLVIVDTEDVLLICQKGRAQDVKNIIKKLKDQNKESYL